MTSTTTVRHEIIEKPGATEAGSGFSGHDVLILTQMNVGFSQACEHASLSS
jgi:hypothetical protein